MNELLRYAQSIISFLEKNGSKMNVESQRALGELLQNLLQVIQEEEKQGGSGLPPPPQPPPGPGPGDIQESMPSSNVEGFAYDDNSNRLFVRFLGKYPNRNGPIYSYEGVPPVMFELFRNGAVPARTDGHNKWGKWWKGKVPSMGASVHTLLKLGGFPYKKVA